MIEREKIDTLLKEIKQTSNLGKERKSWASN
jgi:hypothetical protein